MFRALRHPNFRLFFFCQGFSLIGTWMQQVALSWLVYRLTHSPFLLGFVGFVGMIPTFVCTPFAGVVSDRHDRRHILAVTQILALVQASVLTVLVFANRIEIWHMIVLSACMGFINSFDAPVRQAFTVEMVEEHEDLGNAIALNSSMLNAARLIGPSIAGILVASVGEGACFLINAVSYIPVILSLFMMKIVKERTAAPSRNMILELKEGVGYALRFPPIKWILALLSLVSLMGASFQVVLPIFARDIFHGGPQTFGYLMTTSGLGAMAAALYLAGRKSVIGLAGFLTRMAGLFGISMILFSFVRPLPAAMLIIAVAGFGMMAHMASCNTILQTIVEEDKRGRVMSFYTMAFMGMMPFGSLLAGSLASHIGAPWTLVVSGVCCILGMLFFMTKLPLIRKEIRPVYARKGIIPEVASGIRSAAGLETLAGE